MKLPRALALLAITASLAFACAVSGCGTSGSAGSSQKDAADDFLGSWVVSSGEIDGVSYTLGDLAGVGLNVSVTFGKDGMAYLVIGGEGVSDAYTVSGRTATIVDALDGTKMPFTLSGSELVLDYSKIQWGDPANDPGIDVVLRFAKSGLNEGAAAADFNFEGTWIGDEQWAADDPNNPAALSDLGVEMEIILDADGRGVMFVSFEGGSASEGIYLEPSDRTDSYLVKLQSDGSTFGVLSTATVGDTDWLMVTDADGGMTVSYRRG